MVRSRRSKLAIPSRKKIFLKVLFRRKAFPIKFKIFNIYIINQTLATTYRHVCYGQIWFYIILSTFPQKFYDFLQFTINDKESLT